MKLISVSIRGFRSVEALEDLTIGSPTLLTGHNNAGKSAILAAIQFLLRSYDLTDRYPTFSTNGVPEGNDEDHARPRVAETLVEGAFLLSAAEAAELGCDRDLKLRRIKRNQGDAKYEVLRAIPDDTRLQDFETQSAEYLKNLIDELGITVARRVKDDMISALTEAAANAPSTLGWAVASPAIVRALPRVASFDLGGASAAETVIQSALKSAYDAHINDDSLSGSVRELEIELEKRLSKDAEHIVRHIRERCPDVGEVRILPSVNLRSSFREVEVSLATREGENVHLRETGAGKSRRVALAVWEFVTDLVGRSDDDVVILYDEPDTHLDYVRQRAFMTLVREQCENPNVRMVIATHSMNLIDGVDIADVVHIRHEDHRTAVDRLSDESAVGKHLGAIAASLGLRNTVLLHERLFVGGRRGD
ncbi:ATP-dependent nuclease [Leifsonia xyli]|uniref:ATP-dependent nuclease n=1 Tax=Leifsonia xyli TaxID=1575 RepID=UPI00159F165E|nr:AAA family ATPase [Leifsonia xyli]